MRTKSSTYLVILIIALSALQSACKKTHKKILPQMGQSGNFIDTRDSNSYQWVKIGSQVWMAENLNYKGSDINYVTSNIEWKNDSSNTSWCYYQNKEKYGRIYGVLYQWNAAKKACPNGWHLPTKVEWIQLRDYLKENGYSYDNIIGHEGIAKSLATHPPWKRSYNMGAIGDSNYPEYNNISGFSALPSGMRRPNGFFTGLGEFFGCWSANIVHYYSIYGCSLHNVNNQMSAFEVSKNYGFSIRCIKD